MNRIAIITLIVLTITGCKMTGHLGSTNNSGLEASCVAGCAKFKSDGSGCEKLHTDTSASCLKYFSLICEIAPDHCIEPPLSQ